MTELSPRQAFMNIVGLVPREAEAMDTETTHEEEPVLQEQAKKEHQTSQHDEVETDEETNSSSDSQPQEAQEEDETEPIMADLVSEVICCGMNNDMDNLLEYLNRQNRSYSTSKAQPNVVRSSARGDNGMFPTIYTIDADRKIFSIIMQLDCLVPEEKRGAVAEFIARVNFERAIGSFELDFRDGEIRYRGAFQYDGATLNDTLIENLFQMCGSAINFYYPPLMKVVWGGMAPQEAIHEHAGEQPHSLPIDAFAQLMAALASDDDCNKRG